MDRVNEFISIFNQIENHLRDVTQSTTETTFSELVRRAAKKSRIVRDRANYLKDYGDLRNCLIHSRAYPRQVMAEPTAEAVAAFRRVVEAITAPTPLIPTFARQVRIFKPTERLTDALKYMREHDYSQVVIENNGEISLLTVEGVARWFEQQADEDIVSVVETRIVDALAHELSGSFLFMGRDGAVDDAREAFASAIEHGRPRLYAILVTHSGRKNEKPLGIVTPWDLLENGWRQ